MVYLSNLTRILFLMSIGFFCFAGTVFADTTDQLPDRRDLLPSVTIEAFENLSDRESLQNWIGIYDQTLVAHLAGSKWYTLDIPAPQTSADLWLSLNAAGFIEDLIVITANPTTGAAKVYFESDLLEDASISQDSYWLKLNQDATHPLTRFYMVQEFRNKGFLLGSIELMTESTRDSYTSSLDIFFGIVFGALFALLAYNLALTVQLQSPLHGFYAAYCLSNIFFVAWSTNGVGFQASWYESLGLSPDNVQQFVMWAYMAMTILFIVKFLEPRYRGSILVKGLSLCMAGALSAVVAGYLSGSSIFLIGVYNAFSMLILIQLPLLMVWSWRKGSKNARYTLLAFTPIFFIAMLRTFIEHRGFFLTNGMQIGAVFEMLILSWALTERVRRMRDNAEQARQRAERHERETIQSMNEDLKRQVEERTEDLEDKVLALEISKNELQNALDEISTLKGILPICSYCKKIRDDQGSWEQMESYISAHSDTTFSHGACPDCLEKVKTEYQLNKDQ